MNLRSTEANTLKCFTFNFERETDSFIMDTAGCLELVDEVNELCVCVRAGGDEAHTHSLWRTGL